MSGGVDSTVAAGLLLEQGFEVHGFFMLLPLPGLDEQVSKVQLVADQLGIPLHLIDMQQPFKQEIISYFIRSYQQGTTPNPCVICNRLIKCGRLMEEMAARGMSKMATGHYARIRQTGSDNRFIIQRPTDPTKDQSYFLCRLTGNQLGRLVLPLGDWYKKDVFIRAKQMGFSIFDGSESQDVCFLAGQTLPSFLEQQGVESSPGEITSRRGKVYASHRGIWKYTVGQRRGLGIPDTTPWYVTGLDAEKNRVIIGKNKDLMQNELLLTEVQWQIKEPEQWQGLVQLRSRHRAAEAEVLAVAQDSGAPAMEKEHRQWRVRFKEAQRAITPGQFAVFYQDDQLIGSGIIQDPTEIPEEKHHTSRRNRYNTERIQQNKHS